MHVFESSAWLGQWRRSRLTEAELVTARCAQPGQMAVKGRGDRRQAGLWPAVGEGLSCGVSPGSAARPRSWGAELQAVSLGLGSRTPATVQGHVDGAVGTSLSGGSPPLGRGPRGRGAGSSCWGTAAPGQSLVRVLPACPSHPGGPGQTSPGWGTHGRCRGSARLLFPDAFKCQMNINPLTCRTRTRPPTNKRAIVGRSSTVGPVFRSEAGSHRAPALLWAPRHPGFSGSGEPAGTSAGSFREVPQVPHSLAGAGPCWPRQQAPGDSAEGGMGPQAQGCPWLLRIPHPLSCRCSAGRALWPRGEFPAGWRGGGGG